MTAGDPAYLKRIAEHNALLAAKQVTQPNVPEGLPAVAPQLGQQLPGVQQVVSTGWTLVGTATTTGSAQKMSIPTVPPTTKAIGIAVESLFQGIKSVSLQGGSGTIYLPANPTALGGWFVIPVNAQLETGFTLLFTGTAGGFPVTAWASDLMPSFPALGGSPQTLSLPVALATDNPSIAPWLAPNQPVASGAQAGIGSKQIVLSSSAQVYVFSITIDIDAAAAGSFVAVQDDSGNQLLRCTGTVVSNVHTDHHGAKVATLGDGIQLVVSGGAASAGCTISWSLF